MMSKIYRMVLDGLVVEVAYRDEAVGRMLAFLLCDMQPRADRSYACVARLLISREQRGWRLVEEGGSLSVSKAKLPELALLLLNTGMARLALQNQRSVVLHSGLVSSEAGSFLLAGGPGVGKSNACLWLSHLGMRYHSDEMVLVDRDTLSLSALTRPYTLKRPLVEMVRKVVVQPFREAINSGAANTPDIMESSRNLWLAHRAVNPDYQRRVPPLKAIIFPVYSSEGPHGLTQIPAARAAPELMRGQFYGQRFEDHGFTVISKLLRNCQVYIAVYQSLEQLERFIRPLLQGNEP